MAVLLAVSGLQVVALATVAGSASAASVVTGTGGEFVPVTGRLMDTSTGLGGYSTPMVANAWRSLQVGGLLGVPANASAVQVTLTAVSPAASGIIRVAPSGSTSALSAVIFGSGPTPSSVSNTAIVPMVANGKISVEATSAVRLIVDLQGV
ncbi:hypothetical protein [Nocardioides sp. Iso805N]|uniref:hypothetical protein n=1 Tax=Nocardioides sp. Iso805N TaxID=1283287 RepID=UPI0018DEEC8E|nr:hypothetical protein [Nocardioides sp. Iso805N]